MWLPAEFRRCIFTWVANLRWVSCTCGKTTKQLAQLCSSLISLRYSQQGQTHCTVYRLIHEFKWDHWIISHAFEKSHHMWKTHVMVSVWHLIQRASRDKNKTCVKYIEADCWLLITGCGGLEHSADTGGQREREYMTHALASGINLPVSDQKVNVVSMLCRTPKEGWTLQSPRNIYINTFHCAK